MDTFATLFRTWLEADKSRTPRQVAAWLTEHGCRTRVDSVYSWLRGRNFPTDDHCVRLRMIAQLAGWSHEQVAQLVLVQTLGTDWVADNPRVPRQVAS